MTKSYVSSFSAPWVRDLLVLSMLGFFLFGTFLGVRPLANPDEGRYMEIPREMLVSGDFITPRLNGIKYFEKPVLFYWMEALSFSAFGVNEWSGRLVPLLLALMGILGVYSAGYTLFNQKTGFYGALCLMTSGLYFTFANIITLDMALAVFVSLGLFSFWIGFYTPPSLKRRFLMYAATGSWALALLTKGVVALALAGPLIVIWLSVFGLWKKLWPIYLPSCLFLFLCVTLPWHILVALKNPEFLWFYFINEHFLRFTTTLHGRYHPFWFFIPVFLLGFFPWIFYLFQSIKSSLFPWKERASHAKTGFLFIWIGFIFIFFSVSNSKLIPYILPLFPSSALIIGLYFSKLKDTCHPSAGFKTYALAIFFLSCGILIYSFLSPEMPHALKPFTYIGIFCLWSGLVFYSFTKKFFSKNVLNREFISIFIGVFCFYLFVGYLSPLIPYQSTKAVFLKIKESIPPSTEIVLVKTYAPDLSVYLNQKTPMTIVNWIGEFKFGLEQESCPWIISEDTFLTKWNSPKKICAVLKESVYDSLLKQNSLRMTRIPLKFKEALPRLSLETPYVLICNKP